MSRAAPLPLLLLLAACATNGGPPDASTPDASTPCGSWGATELAARLHVPGLLEASGLVASRVHDGVLWTHNDSGGAPQLFAVGVDGVHRGTWTVEGVSARDWEDLGGGPCLPGDSRMCLFVGDVGDNSGAREEVVVHVVPEPDSLEIREGATLPVLRTLAFTYDTGPHDVESLLVDPATADVYLVEKRPFDDARPRVRRVHRLSTTAEVVHPVAVLVASIVVPGDDEGLFTGGGVRHDGGALLLRTYSNAWELPSSGTGAFVDLFAATPRPVPPVRLGEGETELQGEAIAYARDGRTVFTTSEGETPPLNARPCAD